MPRERLSSADQNQDEYSIELLRLKTYISLHDFVSYLIRLVKLNYYLRPDETENTS